MPAHGNSKRRAAKYPSAARTLQIAQPSLRLKPDDSGVIVSFDVNPRCQAPWWSWQVCIFVDSKSLAEYFGDDSTFAFTYPFKQPQGRRLGEICFALDQLHLDIIVHECVHAAKAWLRLRPKEADNEEWLATATGELSRQVFCELASAGIPVLADTRSMNRRAIGW